MRAHDLVHDVETQAEVSLFATWAADRLHLVKKPVNPVWRDGRPAIVPVTSFADEQVAGVRPCAPRSSPSSSRGVRSAVSLTSVVAWSTRTDYTPFSETRAARVDKFRMNQGPADLRAGPFLRPVVPYRAGTPIVRVSITSTLCRSVAAVNSEHSKHNSGQE